MTAFERIVDKLPIGGIVSQGDHAHIDARVYNVSISAEQRAELLAEVGRALAPVLQRMADRVAALEHENVLLRDTLAARAELSPWLCPQEASRRDHHAPPTLAALDVGSTPVEESHAAPWEPSGPVVGSDARARFYASLRGTQ